MAAPRVVTVRTGGVECCCCCRCCTCLNLAYLRSTPGALKLAELVCGALCETLLLNFGVAEPARLGASLLGFLTTVSGCGLLVWLLLASYVLSEPSCRLVRASLLLPAYPAPAQEPLFNAVAACLYLSASSWLAWAVFARLFPLYKTTVFFEAYPAMTSAYVFGLALGILHSADGYLAYRHYRATARCR